MTAKVRSLDTHIAKKAARKGARRASTARQVAEDAHAAGNAYRLLPYVFDGAVRIVAAANGEQVVAVLTDHDASTGIIMQAHSAMQLAAALHDAALTIKGIALESLKQEVAKLPSAAPESLIVAPDTSIIVPELVGGGPR